MCLIMEIFQNGMGGDHRATHKGAHVCEFNNRGMCVGASTRRTSVCFLRF